MTARPYNPHADVEYAGRTFRATHRVDTPGLSPLFALREQDALDAAEGRGGTSMIFIHGKHPKTGEQSWDFWRMYP